MKYRSGVVVLNGIFIKVVFGLISSLTLYIGNDRIKVCIIKPRLIRWEICTGHITIRGPVIVSKCCISGQNKLQIQQELCHIEDKLAFFQ